MTLEKPSLEIARAIFADFAAGVIDLQFPIHVCFSSIARTDLSSFAFHFEPTKEHFVLIFFCDLEL